MADVLTPQQRSYNMSRIRSKNTKPEEIMRKYLFSRGFRYRKNVSKLPGKPDIVLPKYKTIVFVNGCFWHKHEGCHYFVWPKNNADFWKKKIEGNVERDKYDYKLLKDRGWQGNDIWECVFKSDWWQDTQHRLDERNYANLKKYESSTAVKHHDVR